MSTCKTLRRGGLVEFRGACHFQRAAQFALAKRVEKARADLKIPTGYEPVAMIAVGYPGELATLSDRLRERELQLRNRRPISEWTFSGQWGTPLR